MAEEKQRSITPVTIGQSFFLTFKYFFKNRLLSYAGSCSFSFIFSFIPIIMLVFIILTKLDTDLTVVSNILDFEGLSSMMNTDEMILSAKNINKIDLFTIILGFMILWMARRFLASILDGMQNIFHGQQQRKGAIAFWLAFLVAIIIVVAVSVIIFAYVSIKALFEFNFFESFPYVQSLLKTFYTGTFSKLLPYLILVLVLTIIYKVGPGTKPSTKLALISAILCTATFYVFALILHYFLNVDNYGRIYAGMGNMIILLMNIFFFFTFFLFFAQFIFTFQFFDELLLGELYLLPKREQKGLSTITRQLFIRPDFLLARSNATKYKAGDLIYKVNEVSKYAYYIAKGKVELHNKNKDRPVEKFSRGDFFGEVGCVINKKRDSNAVASTDVILIKVDGEQFQFLVKHNHEASQKAFSQIGSYFTQYDGLQNGLFL